MGRWYSGSIEGKFWFAIQDSNAADRFGVVGHQPEELYYNFDIDFGNEEIETVTFEDLIKNDIERKLKN